MECFSDIRDALYVLTILQHVFQYIIMVHLQNFVHNTSYYISHALFTENKCSLLNNKLIFNIKLTFFSYYYTENIETFNH